MEKRGRSKGNYQEDDGICNSSALSELLPEGAPKPHAAVIVKQSERMRDLINDLNLASILEYDIQPVNLMPQNMIALVRQIVVVDFINADIDEKYPIEWTTTTERECLSANSLTSDISPVIIGIGVAFGRGAYLSRLLYGMKKGGKFCPLTQ